MKNRYGLFAICLCVTCFFALAFLTISAKEDDAIKKDLDLMQGEWSMVSGSADGQTMPEVMRQKMKRIFKGNETTTTMAGRIFIKANVTIDPSKTPKTIDYEMTDGPTKGKKQLGIYEVKEGLFKSCFAKPGGERPTTFSSEADDGHTLSVWKLDKKAETPAEKK